MITELHIENYKCIDSLSIKMGKITVLAGMNSTGKSSVIQALRMLSRYSKNIHPIVLPGIGDLRHLAKTATKPIMFGVQIMPTMADLAEVIQIQCDIMPSPIKDDSKQKSLLPISEPISNSMGKGFFNCVYIGAERIGPRCFLPTKDSLASVTDLGEQCEFVYEFIERYGAQTILPSLKHPEARGDTLNFNISAWLQEIAPGVEFRINEADRRYGIIKAAYDGYNPIHVGFGLSCILPVIVAALGMYLPYQEKCSLPLLAIENPEVHLHPKGQTKIAELLATATLSGCQVVIETHSDHIIDGVRLAVKNKNVDCTDVAIHYFSKDENGGARVESPLLSANGKLTFWPKGFCDQTTINRIKLAK